MLILYYKMLTDSLNWVHEQLQRDDIKQTHKATRFNNFIVYGIAALVPTLVAAGLYLLFFFVLVDRLV